MKDEHDTRTANLLPAASAGGGASAHTAGVAAGIPTAREIKLAKLEIDRGYRAREGLTTYLPVSLVAKEWKITPRRVRALLCSGRLAGRQQENGYWEVAYPYTLTEGTRGPLMRKYAPRKPELRLV